VWDDAGVDWSGFDAALIRSPWDYVAKFDAFTRWIDAASRSTRLLNDAATMRWNLHKR
jgi:glutathione synthase/RimK-type ligase-like ATP-grasp enzyme